MPPKNRPRTAAKAVDKAEENVQKAQTKLQDAESRFEKSLVSAGRCQPDDPRAGSVRDVP
ncbi:hypothetical protein Prubr_27700 [Polymorphospora rubra]|uniref:Uncharacterized protein n=1 Tax=Polymorphospora rubra TaxID=338584 RepID=A0A810N0K3_9ACTN|nr:hypothetical protein Prubr_27700 [Polymorphospora rubra]